MQTYNEPSVAWFDDAPGEVLDEALDERGGVPDAPDTPVDDTLVPPLPPLPDVPLADQLDAVAAVLREAAAQGLPLPDAVHVDEEAVTAGLVTEELLAWQVLFAARPLVTAFGGSPYLRLSGRIGGVLWHLRNEHEIPPPAQRAPAVGGR